MDLTGYSSLFLPNITAFTTCGGSPHETEHRHILAALKAEAFLLSVVITESVR